MSLLGQGFGGQALVFSSPVPTGEGDRPQGGGGGERPAWSLGLAPSTGFAGPPPPLTQGRKEP